MVWLEAQGWGFLHSCWRWLALPLVKQGIVVLPAWQNGISARSTTGCSSGFGEKIFMYHIYLDQFPCWIEHGKCWARHHSSGMPYREKWKLISCRDTTCNTQWCYEKLVSDLERIVGLGINEDLGICGVHLYVFPCNLPVQHTLFKK